MLTFWQGKYGQIVSGKDKDLVLPKVFEAKLIAFLMITIGALFRFIYAGLGDDALAVLFLACRLNAWLRAHVTHGLLACLAPLGSDAHIDHISQS